MLFYSLFFLLCCFLIGYTFFQKTYDKCFNDREVKEFLEQKQIDDLVIFSNSKSVISFLEDLLENGSTIKLYFNKFTYDALYKEDILKLSFLLNSYSNFSLCVSDVDNMYAFIFSNNQNFCFLRNQKHYVFSDHLDFATKQSLKHREMLLNRSFKILNKQNIKIFSNLNLADFE